MRSTAEKSREAGAIIKDPAFQEARDALKQRYARRIVNSKAEQSDLREETYRRHQLVDEVVRELEILYHTGLPDENLT